MMDRNQIWFHGTAAGVIYLLKDLFNASKVKVQNKCMDVCFKNLVIRWSSGRVSSG